jgi:hypothetical protein
MLVVMSVVRACVLCSIPGRRARLGRLSEREDIISCLVPVLRVHGCCCIVCLLEVMGYAAGRQCAASLEV